MYQEPQQINPQHNKFSSLLLSKENFESNSSLRFYYAVSAIAVPFIWESRPGTPKSTITATTIPPLVPPPSFHSISSNKKIARTRSTRSHKSKSIKLTKQGFSSPSSSSWSSSNSQELKGEGKRGFYNMAMIKNALLEIATCSKFKFM